MAYDRGVFILLCTSHFCLNVLVLLGFSTFDAIFYKRLFNSPSTMALALIAIGHRLFEERAESRE